MHAAGYTGGSTGQNIAVVGLGAMGSMILMHLARNGAHVTGYEALDIGSDRTGFGGDSRLFRVAYQEGAVFNDLLLRSRELWLELNHDSGREIFIPCGTISIGDPNGTYLSGLLNSIRDTGCAYELVTEEDLAARFPQHRPLPDEIGVFDPAGGVLRSDLAVITAVDAAAGMGATVLPRTPVDALTPANGGRWEIRSGGKTHAYDQVVLCAGARMLPLLSENIRNQVWPSRILLLWYCARCPDDFQAQHFPTFVRDSMGIHLYGTPSLDGETVKVAGVNPATALESPEQLSRDLTETETTRSNDAVQQFLPGLHPGCVRADAYLDLTSRDHKPLLGWDPDRPGIYIAGGFSGRGFKMASAVGEAAAADIITGHRNRSITFSAPDRFTNEPR